MANPKSTIQQELIVKHRPIEGTRSVRRLRQTGVVPGVVYGRTMEPVSIVMERRALERALHSKSGEHALVKLRMEGDKSWEKPVLVKAIQHHPVGGHVLHVDFHAIVLTERLRVKVPVVLKGEPVGVKQDGGILEHFLREVEIECLPTEIPSSVEFDISSLKINDTVHVKNLPPPTNTKITSDPESVIASIQVPKEEKPEEEAAAVTEPEVLREKKEEPATAAGEGAAKSEASAAHPGASEGRAGEAKKEAK